MTKLQAIIYSLFYLLVISLGLFIAFKVWWAPGVVRFTGLVAFVLVAFGTMLLSVSLTRIIVKSTIDFDYHSLSTLTNYQAFQKTVGRKKANWISAIFFLNFIVLATIIVVYFSAFIKQYKQDQLTDFGQFQKVMIKDIRHKGKGTPYAFFDFYYNEKKYSNDLDQKKFFARR